MKPVALIVLTLYLGFAATPAPCAEKAMAAPADAAQTAKPAAETPDEKAGAQTETEKKIEQAVAESGGVPPRPLARFTVIGDDIVSWEENADKHYIFVSLTDEKNGELAALTAEKAGQPLQITVDDNFFYIPAITGTLSQKNGFVLPVPEGREVEIMRLFDRTKQRAATTAIDIGQPAAAGTGQ